MFISSTCLFAFINLLSSTQIDIFLFLNLFYLIHVFICVTLMSSDMFRLKMKIIIYCSK